jgi:hypothetical protein
MATRPENTRVQNVFNPGVDKRIPAGFVDQVIDKETGNLVGFIKDGKFYNLGEKVPKAVKSKANTGKTERTLDDIDTDLIKWQNDIDYANMRMDAYPTNSPEYKEAQEIFNTAVPKVEQLKAEVKTLQLGKESSTLEKDIDKKEEALQKAKDRNKPTGTITTELNTLKSKKTTLDTSIESEKTKAGIQETRITDGKDRPTPPITDGKDKPMPSNDVQGQTPSTPSAGGPIVPKKTKTPALTDAQEREAALANAAANQDFSLPETLFNNVDELKKLLNDYVTSDKKGGQWTLKKFRNEFLNTNWYKNNSKEIKARYVQLYNYRDQLEGGQDVRNTDYAKQIADLTRQLENKARKIGSDAASDPDALRRTAENMYLTNQGIEDSMTIDFLAASIRPVAGMIGGKVTEGYSGEALANYRTLVQTARENGFQISDILPGGANEQQVLSGIASGTIDINRVAQDARKLAAQGQPQYVRDLLSQGYNLSQVFKPYRQTMANILEIGDPDQIDLNDPLLRSAITDKGDMNLYDFRKALRQDSRWQYTAQAKEDVSTAALQVLRDFGFQG